MSTRRHDLTASQAQALAEIAVRKQNAEKEWDLAVTLTGLDPKKVVGGNLVDNPHFIVSNESDPES